MGRERGKKEEGMKRNDCALVAVHYWDGFTDFGLIGAGERMEQERLVPQMTCEIEMHVCVREREIERQREISIPLSSSSVMLSLSKLKSN